MVKRFISVITVVLLLLCTVFSVHAVTAENIKTKEESVANHLLSCPIPNVGSIGGEWLVIGLARAGKLTDDIKEGYLKNAKAYINAVGGEKLHRSKSTENSRMIIALTSIGENPRDFCGYNLLKPLADFKFVIKQGINGAIWALIAFDTMRYEVPVDSSVTQQTSRELLIKYILDNQCECGGWTLSGDIPDPDITGMALQALSQYRQSNATVEAAVNKAVEYMSITQKPSGDFSANGEITPESSAQMITALSALHIDSNSDDRFIKNGKTVFDSLFGFSVDNGFEHTKGVGYNQMSTEQGYYAIVSYLRYKNNQSALYDMTDLIEKYDIDLNGTVNISDATYIQKYLAMLSDFSLLQQKLADLNRDGKVDIADVTILQKYLSKK